jgi:hypothetical protein
VRRLRVQDARPPSTSSSELGTPVPRHPSPLPRRGCDPATEPGQIRASTAIERRLSRPNGLDRRRSARAPPPPPRRTCGRARLPHPGFRSIRPCAVTAGTTPPLRATGWRPLLRPHPGRRGGRAAGQRGRTGGAPSPWADRAGAGRAPGSPCGRRSRRRAAPAVATAVAGEVLALDENPEPFYRLTDADPLLSWAAPRGAGRSGRRPSSRIWRKLICTNCAWSATHHGERPCSRARRSRAHGQARLPTAPGWRRAGVLLSRGDPRRLPGGGARDLAERAAREPLALERLRRISRSSRSQTGALVLRGSGPTPPSTR